MDLGPTSMDRDLYLNPVPWQCKASQARIEVLARWNYEESTDSGTPAEHNTL